MSDKFESADSLQLSSERLRFFVAFGCLFSSIFGGLSESAENDSQSESMSLSRSFAAINLLNYLSFG